MLLICFSSKVFAFSWKFIAFIDIKKYKQIRIGSFISRSTSFNFTLLFKLCLQLSSLSFLLLPNQYNAFQPYLFSQA